MGLATRWPGGYGHEEDVKPIAWRPMHRFGFTWLGLMFMTLGTLPFLERQDALRELLGRLGLRSLRRFHWAFVLDRSIYELEKRN